MAELLLDRGADIEAKSFANLTPLHIAVLNGYEAMAGLLLRRGADTEAKDSDNQTPLHIAALNGYEAMVRLLLGRGADIEAKDSSEQTPLHLAVLSGHEAAIGLLRRGADIEAKDFNNQTPKLCQFDTRKLFAAGDGERLLQLPEGCGSGEVRGIGQRQDQSGVPSSFAKSEAGEPVKLDYEW